MTGRLNLKRLVLSYRFSPSLWELSKETIKETYKHVFSCLLRSIKISKGKGAKQFVVIFFHHVYADFFFVLSNKCTTKSLGSHSLPAKSWKSHSLRTLYRLWFTQGTSYDNQVWQKSEFHVLWRTWSSVDVTGNYWTNSEHQTFSGPFGTIFRLFPFIGKI